MSKQVYNHKWVTLYYELPDDIEVLKHWVEQLHLSVTLSSICVDPEERLSRSINDLLGCLDITIIPHDGGWGK